jgi:hypothetical protein
MHTKQKQDKNKEPIQPEHTALSLEISLCKGIESLSVSINIPVRFRAATAAETCRVCSVSQRQTVQELQIGRRNYNPKTGR